MMYGYEHGWDAGGWVLMSVLILVVVGAVIVSVLSLIHSSRPRVTAPAQAAEASGSALRTLDERFARGDIDEADYTTRRDLLTSR